MNRLSMLAAACAIALLIPGPALAQSGSGPDYVPQSGQAGKDVVWVPTPQALVDRMLDMAKVTPDDYVIDLGSGDGRTVITAAKRGIRAHGIEYNPDMVALSLRNAQAEGVTKLATFVRGDIFESDFSRATVVTLFLLPSLNLKLRPTLLAMKPGTRIVSNSFDMAEWEPDERIEAGADCTNWCRAFKWIVPAHVVGEWQLGKDRLKLNQNFQMLEGSLLTGDTTVPITEGKMNGAEIAFTAGGRRYKGEVKDGAMSGRFDDGTIWRATRIAG